MVMSVMLSSDETPSRRETPLPHNDEFMLRKGKWSFEEEEFATALIDQFLSGRIDLTEGTTLRVYLSDKLNCDPMRITKKFTGQDCLGKRVYPT